MSEKIYARLLRLYPAHFRETYGEDALQLFRDRSRDERGFFPRLRLWLDLLADFAISVPRAYRHAQPAIIGASAHQRLDEAPSFQILEGESPRPEALLFAALLALVAVGGISVLIGHGGSYRPLGGSSARPQHRNGARSSAFGRPAQAAGQAEEEIVASGQPTMDAASLGHGDGEPGDLESTPLLAPGGSGFAQSQVPQPGPQGTAGARDENMKLDAAERQRVIHAAIANLKAYYIDRSAAERLANALVAHEKNGDYNAVTDGAAFADLLTRQLRDVSHDMHLDLIFSRDRLPDRPQGQTPERLARYRMAMEQQNCTFEKAGMRSHNIGYLKLNSFPDPSVCQSTATAAMASLNHADAIIFDLRNNGGGYPDMVKLIASYLFDHPEYMYNPRENTTERSWTRSPVPGNRLADKPVYVLISARTFSGAEHFSYDLKMLKRATLVGETTGGAAHSGVFHRIDDHFGMGIPETRAINPFSATDWAVTGVEPDVKVKAADALETAEKLAERKLQKKK